MICSSGESLNTEGGCSDGTWTSANMCPDSTAICGYNLNFQPYSSVIDNTAINDIRFHCCLVCKYSAGMYRSSDNSCKLCDQNCLACSGSSTHCTACGLTDTLISGTCVSLANYYEYSASFNDPNSFINDINNNGWKINGAAISPVLQQCGDFYILGPMVPNDNLTNNLILSPHYRVRIKARIYKIDQWNSEAVIVNVDGKDLNISQLQFSKNEYIFFGNLCSNSAYPEDTTTFDIEFPHYSDYLQIKISSTITGSITNWAISHIIYGEYLCNANCKTCSGSLNNECSSCYEYATLQSDGTCICDDGYYTYSSALIGSYNKNLCGVCSNGCKTCYGSSLNQCTFCFATFYFDNNQVSFISIIFFLFIYIIYD